MAAISSKNPAVGIAKNPDFHLDYRGTPIDGAGGTRSAKKPCLDKDKNDASDTIKALLGSDVAMTSVMTRDLDTYSGYPHTTTGIPYAIQGTAKVLNIKVGEYLAAFADPIKAILSTNIHTESRVVITRKYVVGGRAMITPEHAPARTVAIQEDVREVQLTRYGGDIEMNLNLFLRPEDAREELDMKVGAQRRELERVLVDIGYDMLLREGVDLVDGIIRSSPLYSAAGGTKQQELFDAAERINTKQVFGAMSKHAYPVQNLLAAARYASAYSTSNEKGSVLLLPHGLPDILRYTRQENMTYEIAGPALMERNNGKKIDMSFEGAFTDPSTSVRILVHRQMPTFEHGVANPDVPMGALTDMATFGCYYEMKGQDTAWSTFITDFENNGVREIKLTLSENPKAGYVPVLVRRRIQAVMSSGILAAPGEETGSLLVGYPFTSVSTSSQEIVKIQMRVYMGSVLKKPENVIILRNIYFEGLKEGHRFKMTDAANVFKDAKLDLPDSGNKKGLPRANSGAMKAGFDLGVVFLPKAYLDSRTCINLLDFNDNASTEAPSKGLVATDLAAIRDSFGGFTDGDNYVCDNDTPSRMYRGTTYVNGKGQVEFGNTGHMDILDDFRTCSRLFGAFVYNSDPDPKNTNRHPGM